MLLDSRHSALLPACIALSCAAATPRECIAPAFPRAPVADALVLLLDEIASLPGGTVLLAGCLHDGANTVRSVLHVSRDGGRTWRDSGLCYDGSAILDLRTFGTSNVWGLVTFRQEGCSEPTHVVRSVDAGATWSVAHLANEGEGQQWASRFEFDDARHGLLSVASSLGSIRTFRTDDGGASWQLLWTARRPRGVEEGADVPPLPAAPPAAPLWERDADTWRVAGWLRLHTGPDATIIEELRIRGPDAWEWRECSRLPRRYRAGWSRAPVQDRGGAKAR